MMKFIQKYKKIVFILPLLGVPIVINWGFSQPVTAGTPAPALKAPVKEGAASKAPVMGVTLIKPEKRLVQEVVKASGRVQPWQEIKIAPEITGMLVKSVNVDVGARVHKGQLLAQLDTEKEVVIKQQLQAQLEADKATLSQAKAEYERTHAAQKMVADSNVFSDQDLQKVETTYQSAQSKVKISEAALAAQELRIRQANIIAPADGLISYRLVTPGQVAQGSEFFRLIRDSRFEWNAEVPVAAIEDLNTGNKVEVVLPSGAQLSGSIARFSPLVSSATDTGIVYVTLPSSLTLKSGMFVTGTFAAHERERLVVPGSAVVVKDGRYYVVKVNKQGIATRVNFNARLLPDGSYAVDDGLQDSDHIVKSGAAFIATGDKVSVVEASK